MSSVRCHRDGVEGPVIRHGVAVRVVGARAVQRHEAGARDRLVYARVSHRAVVGILTSLLSPHPAMLSAARIKTV